MSSAISTQYTNLFYPQASFRRPDLHQAIQDKGSSLEAIEDLLSPHSINQTKNGLTPLLLSLMSNREDVAKLLVEKGAQIDTRTPEGKSPIHLAAEKGLLEVMELLISQDPSAVDLKSTAEWTPLYYAVENNQAGAVRCLLRHKANVHAQHDEDVGLIHLAVCENFIEIVEALTSHDFNLANSKMPDGHTPLYIAALKKRHECIKLLLDHNADPALQGPYGLSPFHIAITLQDIAMLKLFLLHDRDLIYLQTGAGTPPLKLAESLKNAEMLTLLTPRQSERAITLSYQRYLGSPREALHTRTLHRRTFLPLAAQERTDNQPKPQEKAPSQPAASPLLNIPIPKELNAALKFLFCDLHLKPAAEEKQGDELLEIFYSMYKSLPS